MYERRASSRSPTMRWSFFCSQGKAFQVFSFQHSILREIIDRRVAPVRFARQEDTITIEDSIRRIAIRCYSYNVTWNEVDESDDPRVSRTRVSRALRSVMLSGIMFCFFCKILFTHAVCKRRTFYDYSSFFYFPRIPRRGEQRTERYVKRIYIYIYIYIIGRRIGCVARSWSLEFRATRNNVS